MWGYMNGYEWVGMIFGVVSMLLFWALLFVFIYPFSQLLTSLEVRHVLGRHFYLVTILWITSPARWVVIQTKAAKTTYLCTAAL